MQMSSKRAVLDFLGQRQWKRVLDAPCGHGWLGEGLRGRYDAIDGMDLFCDAPEGYGAFWKQAASSASRLGRHLIVHARRAGEDPS